MGLKKYRAKRNIKKSREPAAKKKQSKGSLRFCVQRHDASHLHYDFRLEHQGVLLSWAIPKGPSLNPKDKRLAIQVEDHPLDYQYFEGVIPKGNYGAGTVAIWDQGTYTVAGASSRQEAEDIIGKGLKKGHLDLILDGEKLSGGFLLIKLKQSEKGNEWLLIKKEDSSSGTLKKKRQKSTPMPKEIPPMLATSVDKPFNDDNWLFEIKWDGYRSIAYINKGKVELKSRLFNILNSKFPAIADSLKKIPGQVILDGELVVVDREGKSDFQLMQNYQKTRKGNLFFYVFDLLYQDGQNLRERPLIERKEILQKLIQEISLPLIRMTKHITGKGIAFFNAAAKKGLEGIIGKKSSSTYQSRRSKDWVKIKTLQRQEVVIGGFTEPRGSRKKFGALLAGFYQEGKLMYAGHVGGGFNQSLLDDVYKQLKPLIQTKCPFAKEPKPNEAVTWTKPLLVCEVSFAEWTKDNIMRQPIFHGLREDKHPKEVKKETVDKAPPSASLKKSNNKSNGLSLTHLDKIYWPKEKYTKGDLIAYYETVGSYILPYLKDRPIVLYRFPDGINGEGFYQKEINFALPKFIKTAAVKHENKTIHYLLIDNLSGLLYAINLGSIDLHPFSCRLGHLNNPDFCVIDLDPHDIAFDQVIVIANAIHEILDEARIKHFCKTSGGKGLHIFMPLHAKYDYDQSRQFAEVIATIVNRRYPKITSLERNPAKRPKKIYLDCLQNRSMQTLVAPYSVRPRPGACVSTPLLWEEVKKGLDSSKFNIETVPARLKELGDIFRPVMGPGINMETSLNHLKVFFA